jgi:hypothetical protein
LSGWTKANVLKLFRLVPWVAAILILLKRRHFHSIFLSYYVVLSSFSMTSNVLALGEVSDLVAQNFQITTKFDAKKNVQLTTSLAIEPNAC